MGDPIEEYEAGDNCVTCWGAGKDFGDYPTPKRVYIEGSGFIGIEAPCNGKFIAEQDAVNHCLWEFDDGTRWGKWWLTIVESRFMMGISGGPEVFNTSEAKCVKVSVDGAAKVEVL